MIGGENMRPIRSIEAPSARTGPQADTHREHPTFSVIVPAYNEAQNIRPLHERLSDVMSKLGNWEVVYVNDGSQDGTLERLRELRFQDCHVSIVNLSRNFGKEIATTAGLDHVVGDAVVIIDADLQDPPEIIPSLVEEWRHGFDIVYAQRRKRDGETWLKRFSAKLFYKVMSNRNRTSIPRDAGDFRLMSRRAVEALRSLHEHHRFMKGLFAWIGFPSIGVQYDRAPRFRDESKWSYWKLWNLALEAITSHTVAPLKIASYVGSCVSLLAVFYGAFIVGRTIVYGNPVAGYPSLLTIILFLGGIQLMTLGIMGEYLGRIFNETKSRPLYFVECFEPSELAHTRAERGTDRSSQNDQNFPAAQ